MFVINPDPFLLPSYRISPFKTDYLTINNQLADDDFSANYFNERFGAGNWQYTYNGREAIELALQQYQLDAEDVVTILTTSENFYISSCVTKSIEKFCRWNRELTSQTKLIFINHEFGYPYPNMEKALATGLPIIEDCCTTFFSQDEKQQVGKYGDFSIYSFPKFFPLQIGGLLVNNTISAIPASEILDKEQTNYLQNVMSNQLKNTQNLLRSKNENYEYALAQFSKLGFTARFQKNENVVPSVLLLNNNSIIPDLGKLKIFLTEHGIQSSVFYGEDAFFVPNHQSLSQSDINYIFSCVKAYADGNH